MVQEWTLSLRNAYPDWGRERWQRRLERKLRRRAEREAKIANASLFEGYLWLLGAVVLFIVAMSALPAFFWLLFPAAGLASRGARVIARNTGLTRPLSDVSPGPVSNSAPLPARAQRFGNLGGTLQNLGGIRQVLDGSAMRQPFPGASAPATGAPQQQDPRDVRVDAVCDRILAELRTSPESVKDIFIKPEETVQALRVTCRDLTRRERDVRRFLSPEEDTRLASEREVLKKRVENEADEVTKMRLASALAALDQQRDQRGELARAATRFDAEHTRISYTLESLHTQVVRMRSADSSSVDVAGAGLRRSLDLLSQEVNALADALEKVNSGEAARMRNVAEGPSTDAGSGPGPSRGTREKS